MSARKTDTEQRREQITQAALDLINDQGVSGLSIAGIARRVGIVPSALYRHFTSKDAVLDAVLDLIQQRLLDNVAHVRRKTPVPLKQLNLLFSRHTAMLSENRAIPHVVFSDAVYNGQPDRKAKVAQIITAYLKEVEFIIESGRQDGTICKAVIPATAAVMFLGLIMPAAVLWNVSEGNFDMTAHINTAWPAYERSIAVQIPKEAS
ncbi:MAG: TetR/AcrR family transcriptional regulator [Desulfotignum balticum]|uniref:TetR/AcrR family transcriptional regulator n=1 Tax=Desulfotignum balticum TaxID=115781 RepID=A0A931GEJ3_9BACT|nr:TetR/AcrR family transcriptional regulator [Desulfotignum balticum]